MYATKKLREVRERVVKATKREMADALGMEETSYLRIEGRDRPVNIPVAVAISRALRMRVKDLFEADPIEALAGEPESVEAA